MAAAAPRPGVPEHELEEIVVTASFRQATLAETPVSITVLPEKVLREAGLQHFADVLGLVPNLNWSGGTSRPRYFQLRGVGELEQYQGAPNPSVGFLIDEIDFSGVGMPATLFDVDQVEVLRGPQGTRYGANALAGLIKVKTRDPDGSRDLDVELTAGNDAVQAAGLAVGGPLGTAEEGDGWRLVAQHFA
jgi:iron complex outermembrane receptor protein